MTHIYILISTELVQTGYSQSSAGRSNSLSRGNVKESHILLKFKKFVFACFARIETQPHTLCPVLSPVHLAAKDLALSAVFQVLGQCLGSY